MKKFIYVVIMLVVFSLFLIGFAVGNNKNSVKIESKSSVYLDVNKSVSVSESNIFHKSFNIEKIFVITIPDINIPSTGCSNSSILIKGSSVNIPVSVPVEVWISNDFSYFKMEIGKININLEWDSNNGSLKINN